MRLWHQDLISYLPRQQLLGQHRECAALRGNGWNRKHKTVNYVFKYSPYRLYQYHMFIIKEMKRRGYKVDLIWETPEYRGKKCKQYGVINKLILTDKIYPEHDDDYYQECIDNLESKGVALTA